MDQQSIAFTPSVCLTFYYFVLQVTMNVINHLHPLLYFAGCWKLAQGHRWVGLVAFQIRLSIFATCTPAGSWPGNTNQIKTISSFSYLIWFLYLIRLWLSIIIDSLFRLGVYFSRFVLILYMYSYLKREFLPLSTQPDLLVC